MDDIIAYFVISAVVLVVATLTACAKAEPQQPVIYTERPPAISVSAPTPTPTPTPKQQAHKRHKTDQRTCWDFPECVEYNRIRYGRK
jgi:hypothetical protein